MAYPDNFYGLSEDQVIEAIENGTTLTAISLLVGKNKSMLTRWLMADEQRFARTNAARILAASAWDELAEHEIKQAQDPFELTRARELAHHYRWRASKIAPKEYGDKMETTHVGAQPVVIEEKLSKT